VTNNRSDFLALHGREPLHAGVIIIVPSVTPVCQRELFSAALKHIGARDLTNAVVEAKYEETRIVDFSMINELASVLSLLFC